MSIFINGMDMPKNCCGCVFSLYTPTGKTPFCKRTGKDLAADVYFNKRDSDCPLVPVPPHGDLIDRSQLCDDSIGGDYGSGTRVYYAYEVEHAPVIIPAEPPKEET